MAYKEIEKLIGSIVRQSAFYISEPWGFQSDHLFTNTVVCVSTLLTPHELLRQTQAIEHSLGKNSCHATERTVTAHQQPAIHYHDRPIDIDILLYDNLHIDTPDLKIPHPLMQERDFVMKPLNEILQ